MEKVKLSIIIPVYNEVKTILEAIRRVQNEPHEKEIIIVDDGSCDGTTELLRQIKDTNIKLLYHDTNKGKGYAIRTAIPHISTDIVITQDADLEYYPDEYNKLIKPLLTSKADVVYGSRFLKTRQKFNFYTYLANIIINAFANLLLDTHLTDIMTGHKAFKSHILKSLTLTVNGFAFEVEVTVRIFKRGFKIYETPILYECRSYDKGKKIKWFDFFVCLYWIIKAHFNNE